MTIHKKEVAHRQLETAIDLFFAKGDLLAVITLAGAAEEILGRFLQREDKPSSFTHIVELDKRDCRLYNYTIS